MSDFIIDVAPVQGHTDAAWRHFHKSIYGGCQSYYTPFIRLERGDFRKHDLKDYTSELNGNHEVAAQVIFRDMAELRPLIEGLVERGVKGLTLTPAARFLYRRQKAGEPALSPTVRNISGFRLCLRSMAMLSSL